MVRASDLRLNGREFDPGHRTIGRLVPYWDGCDLLRTGIASRYVTSHPGQLSLLPSVGCEMSTAGTGRSAVMGCGLGVKAGCIIIAFVDNRVGGGKTV